MFNKYKLLKNKQLLLLLQHFRSIRSITNNNNNNNKITKNVNKNKQKVQNNDYLGIFDANYEEMKGIYDRNDSNSNDLDKYRPLFEKRNAKLNEEKILVTSFGKVRLDSDNSPTFHGQYDDDFKQNKFDIDLFEDHIKSHRNHDKIETQPTKEKTCVTNIIEDHYFGKQLDEENNAINNNNRNETFDNNNDNEFEFIDRQYFSKSANFEPLIKSKINFKYSQEFTELREEKVSQEKCSQKLNYRRSIDEKKEINELTQFDSPLKQELFSANYEIDYDFLEKRRDIESEFESDLEIENNKKEEIKLEEVKKVEFLTPNPKTGAQYLRDIQMGKVSPHFKKLFTDEVKKFGAELSLRGEKLDSKGFRVLSGQVFDYNKFTNEDIVEMLWNRILFNDSDIIAINKPYGMSIHSTKESKSGPVLTQFLPQLSERLECKQLYTVHRLDKDTTGILLLTKSQEKAHSINRLFAEHKISKQYWCITRGVPDHREGIIDIPIEMGKVDGKQRMVLRPEALEEYRSVIKPSKTAKRAVTQYRVISESNNASLLEILPQTGVRHQIRIHLGFGLRCPILGDHKYSHLDKMAPQKLTADMLIALNVRQSKVRHIPMHLHARQYCLPQAGNEGKNIFINAPLPPHFVKNMSSLKLRH